MLSTAEIEKLTDNLLLVLRQQAGDPAMFGSLCKELKCDSEDLRRSIELLQQWEYAIDLQPDRVSFLAAPDLLTATEIGYELDTEFCGTNIAAYRSVKSTNDIATQLAQSGAAEGTIVVADEQTAGRGRLGRQWHSPPNTGIYLSIILRPNFDAEKAPGLSIMTALALAETLKPICGDRMKIKWPNDVLISGLKVAGILTELTAEREKINFVVIGIGINAKTKRDQFPKDIRAIATSLTASGYPNIRRADLVRELLTNIENEYRLYCAEQLSPSLDRLRAYSSLLGRPIKLAFGQNIIEGIARDISSDGSLIVEKDGLLTSVVSGEVSVTSERDC